MRFSFCGSGQVGSVSRTAVSRSRACTNAWGRLPGALTPFLDTLIPASREKRDDPEPRPVRTTPTSSVGRPSSCTSPPRERRCVALPRTSDRAQHPADLAGPARHRGQDRRGRHCSQQPAHTLLRAPSTRRRHQARHRRAGVLVAASGAVGDREPRAARRRPSSRPGGRSSDRRTSISPGDELVSRFPFVADHSTTSRPGWSVKRLCTLVEVERSQFYAWKAAAPAGHSQAITSSTSSGGNTRVNRPTDTRSDNRRSETGFTYPARGTAIKVRGCHLTERYWG